VAHRRRAARASYRELVREHRAEVSLRRLPEPVYWGGSIEDERYLVLSPA